MERDYLSKDMTTGMKGYLCLCILAHHLQMFSGVFSNTYFGHFINRLGGWGVALFFFISGYGLFKSYESKGDDYIKKFPKNRLLPFYVTYLFWVAVYSVMLYETVTLKTIIRSVTFGGTIVSFGWYFQFIGIFYILFYLVFRFAKHEISKYIYVALLIAFSIFCYFFHERYTCFIPFVAGIIVAVKKEKIDSCLKKNSLIILIGSFLTFFAIYLLYIYAFIYGRYVFNPFVWEMCLSISDLAVIFFAVSFCYVTRKLPIIVNPVSKWFGKYSAEIYTCQGIALYLCYFTIEKVGLYIAVCVFATIFLAVISHMFLEWLCKKL